MSDFFSILLAIFYFAEFSFCFTKFSWANQSHQSILRLIDIAECMPCMQEFFRQFLIYCESDGHEVGKNIYIWKGAQISEITYKSKIQGFFLPPPTSPWPSVPRPLEFCWWGPNLRGRLRGRSKAHLKQQLTIEKCFTVVISQVVNIQLRPLERPPPQVSPSTQCPLKRPLVPSVPSSFPSSIPSIVSSRVPSSVPSSVPWYPASPVPWGFTGVGGGGVEKKSLQKFLSIICKSLSSLH